MANHGIDDLKKNCYHQIVAQAIFRTIAKHVWVLSFSGQVRKLFFLLVEFELLCRDDPHGGTRWPDGDFLGLPQQLSSHLF